MKPTNKLADMSSGLGGGKIFDVARPGRSPASSTSKPVIVGHKPQIQDPMMAHDIDDERRLLGSHERVTVAPPSNAEPVAQVPEPTPEPTPEAPPAPSAEPEPEPSPDAPASPALSTSPEEPAPEPEPVPAPPTEQSQQPAPPQSDPLLDDDTATPEPNTMPTAVVSHHHHASGAFKNVAVAVLILLIIGAGVFDILLDAGFVVLTIPHTHFF